MTAVMDPELLKVVKELNKKHGDGTVLLASDIDVDMLPRRTSGSLSLDVILGGGWPCNQAVEIVGESSHGKSAVCLKTIAANQQADPNFVAVWVAAEEWVPTYAEMCGVDLERVYVVETNVMEDALDAVIRFAESKAVDCIVIDSLPALVPSAEEEKGMEGLTVGRGAATLNKFFRIIGMAIKRSLITHERPVLLLCINQYRQKIGVTMGSDKTTPGGQGKNYAFFVRVEVKRDGWIEVGPKSSRVKIGQSIRVRTIKNKTCPPMQTAYLDFYFADGGEVSRGSYDWGKELIAVARLAGVIEQRGGWFYWNSNQWQGAPAMLEGIRADADLYEALEAEVRSLPVGSVVL